MLFFTPTVLTETMLPFSTPLKQNLYVSFSAHEIVGITFKPCACQYAPICRERYMFHIFIGIGISIYSEKSGDSTHSKSLRISTYFCGSFQTLSNW